MVAELKKVPSNSSWEKQVAESTDFQQEQFLDEGQNDSFSIKISRRGKQVKQKAVEGQLNTKLTCEERVFTCLYDKFSDGVLNFLQGLWGNTFMRLLW